MAETWRCFRCLVTHEVRAPRHGVEFSRCAECGQMMWSTTDGNSVAHVGIHPNDHPDEEAA